MTRVESLGSIWMLDDDALRYARMPKHEGPRQSPDGEDWGGEGAGALQDLKWHPMKSWEIREQPIIEYRVRWWPSADPTIEPHGTGETQPILVIRIEPDPETGTDCVVAPDAVVAA